MNKSDPLLYTFDLNYGNDKVIFDPKKRLHITNGHPWNDIDLMMVFEKKELLEKYYSVAPIWKDTINYKSCIYYAEYNSDTNKYWYDIKDRIANNDILKYDRNWIADNFIIRDLKVMIDDAYKDSIPMEDSIYIAPNSKAICQCDLNEVFNIGHEFNCPEENVKKRRPPD